MVGSTPDERSPACDGSQTTIEASNLQGVLPAHRWYIHTIAISHKSTPIITIVTLSLSHSAHRQVEDRPNILAKCLFPMNIRLECMHFSPNF